MYNIATSLQIPTSFHTTAPPTPINTPVNRSKTWSQLPYPPPPRLTMTHHIPPIINHTICLPPKYPPQYCYYTDGSFIPPKAITEEYWHRERAGYGIYNPFKNLQIAVRLPGLQNILRAELMAIHHTLCLLTITYRNEPAHIFTDCLNVLYLLTTQIKNPTSHNSHPDKTILELIVTMLQSRTQTTTLHKVKAHTNISGNEQADKLAKMGCDLSHRDAIAPYEHAHPTPYYLQKGWWHSMQETPDKGPIRHLGKYILKHDQQHNLALIATQTHQLHKWLDNKDIDKSLSNDFWHNPIITDRQKTCLIKFRTGQYMGHARKQLFFGRTAYPSHTCPICNSLEADTWLHVLLKCKQ
jgi:ribonuclease HI